MNIFRTGFVLSVFSVQLLTKAGGGHGLVVVNASQKVRGSNLSANFRKKIFTISISRNFPISRNLQALKVEW